VGPIGSGKTEAVQIFERDFGYQVVNSGQVLASLLNVPAVTESTRLQFQKAAWAFIRKPSGPRLLAEAIAGAVNAKGSQRILIDGIRQLATLAELRFKVIERGLGTVYIHTPFATAFDFYRLRAQTQTPSSSVTIEDFLKVRSSDVEMEVSTMINTADAVLYNWTGKVFFARMVRAFHGSIGRDRG
jgi:hypothetical protein